LDDLLAHPESERVASVFELGCGTGRLALCLLTRHLSSSASYLGIDVSKTMIDIASERIAPYAKRSRVMMTDGSVRFPLSNHSVDRVFSTYVLDLLAETDINQAISEAHRVLTTNGKLCLVSLTKGIGFASRIVSNSWAMLFRVRPSLVGGCRPVRLEPFIDRRCWSVEYRRVVTQFSVPSEVILASPEGTPCRSKWPF
jgi:ubiquinone/menaquinone biosynthesis C-methylase UbiE